MFSVPVNPNAKDEKIELLKAWAGTTLAFGVLMRNIPGLGLVQALIMSAIVAGAGVILHELAHRVVARHYNLWPKFIANDAMLVISVLLAFTGFLFFAPGAVYHSGAATKRESGLIAAAGPATNIVLAIISLALLLIGVPNAWMTRLLQFSFQLNSWLGLFNLIPFGPLDGAKVLEWSGAVFAAMAGIAVMLVFGVDFILRMLA